jgi:hypothetical protein
MKKPRRRKRLGRPRTGHDPLLSIRLPKTMLRAIDAWAGKFPGRVTRTAAIRSLIQRSLDSPSRRMVDPKRPGIAREVGSEPLPTKPTRRELRETMARDKADRELGRVLADHKARKP